MNTSSAGPGALAVTIDGPSKVKMDCQECPEGYKVTYTPMAPGNYLISIKYGGPYHIVGSPFKAKITGEKCRFNLLPFPSKVFSLKADKTSFWKLLSCWMCCIGLLVVLYCFIYLSFCIYVYL